MLRINVKDDSFVKIQYKQFRYFEMSDSQSHDMDEEPIIYEEEEVLWAKIRGYPWWPAFVDKVHGANSNSDDQIDYTVFFFGDNTHSRLGASKLRRFLDYYTEFFPKAKTNRKLYLSIMKAEEKLKQNGGNIQIFQTLRNSLKKSKKGRGPHKTQSKISSEDHANNLSEQPELVRNKTFPNHEQKQVQQVVSQQQKVVQQQKPSRRKSKKDKSNNQKEQKQKIEPKEANFQSQESEKEQQIEQPRVLNYRTRSGKNKNQISKIQQSKQSNPDQQKGSFSQSDNEQTNKKNNFSRALPKSKPISRNAPKKRGRPKKVVQDNQQQEQSSEQSMQEQSENNKNTPSPVRPLAHNDNRKTRLERKNEPKQSEPQVKIEADKQKQKVNEMTQQKSGASQQIKQMIIQRVKFCLDKRNQLIEYLDRLNVTTDIVKEILDLDVTTVILQRGDMTQEGVRVLQKLKSALLHKYFPDDIKIRKKYQKLTKKAQSLKTNTTQNQQSLEDLQLRKKTVIKLEKILRSIKESNNEKQKAIDIEQYFRKYDESIGTGYKTIAYRVLRSLKDKNCSVDEIMSKLDSGDFDDDQK